MGCFKLGINMAGAVSAGAYTAGVLDFLLEALEEWYAAKERGEDVPAHDLSIEVLSGASAGGMCAAIAAAQMQQDCGPPSILYESWVNRIDIRELLKTRDLSPGKSVVSLLDSTIIADIAEFALAPRTPRIRPYCSPRLTLLLSLTNLRGVPYSLNGAALGSLEQKICYYADWVRFVIFDLADADLHDLRIAAMATGAFPVFLAPRVLTRRTDDYFSPRWRSTAEPPASPDWPFQPGSGATWQTLNVDGGLTDNDPFELAREHLRSLDPPSRETSAAAVDRAVLTIAPFPAQEAFDAEYQPAEHAGLLAAAARLFSALISQSRFFGESLDSIATGTDFSRFVIAPSDASMPGKPALQCAALGAFGGFFERGFRAHDYELGRRNCQQFLRCHLVLPAENPVMQNAGGPIIPLCGTAAVEVPVPARATMRSSDLDEVVGLIATRFEAVLPRLAEQIPSRTLRTLLGLAGRTAAILGKGKLKEYLERQLQN